MDVLIEHVRVHVRPPSAGDHMFILHGVFEPSRLRPVGDKIHQMNHLVTVGKRLHLNHLTSYGAVHRFEMVHIDDLVVHSSKIT